MRFDDPRTRFGWLALCLLAAAGLGAQAAWRHVVAEEEAPAAGAESADQSPADADETAQDLDSDRIDEDLRGKVRLYLSPELRHRQRTTYTYTITARLDNITKDDAKEDLAGPIRLAILGTRLKPLDAPASDEAATASDGEPEAQPESAPLELEVLDSDGSLDSGAPFFNLVKDEKILAAGRKTASVTIAFKHERRLTRDEVDRFELEYRVTREGLDYADRKDEPVRELADRGKSLTDKEGRPYDEEHPEVRKVMATQDRWHDEFMRQEGIYGTSTSMDEHGRLVVKVYVARLGLADHLPKQVDGVPVKIEVSTRPRAQNANFPDNRGQAGRPLPQPPGPPPVGTVGGCVNAGPFPPCYNIFDPTARFPRPAPIGVDIQNINFVRTPPPVVDNSTTPPTIINYQTCHPGTYGCRVRRGGQVFVLGTNHTLARMNEASLREPIIQANCNNGDAAPADTIARLSDFHLIAFDYHPVDPATGLFLKVPSMAMFPPNQFVRERNVIDAAIAETRLTLAERITPCIGYGAPSQTLARAAIGQRVQKMGGASGYTVGYVTSLNVNTSVTYSHSQNRSRDFFGQPMPPLTGQTRELTNQASFQRQIEIVGINLGPFSDAPDDFRLLLVAPGIVRGFTSPGDSGALVVTDPERKPIGMIFAGGGGNRFSLANPIQDVLRRFNVTIDGDCP